MNALNSKTARLATQQASLSRSLAVESDVPISPKALKKLLKEKFLLLAVDSYEFGAMLPKIVPEIFIYCVRMETGGRLLQRAKVTIDLTGSFETAAPERLRNLLRREVTFDLFDSPQAELVREQTSMKALELADTLIVQYEPSDDTKKLRRHRHARYSFSIQDGYERPQL